MNGKKDIIKKIIMLIVSIMIFVFLLNNQYGYTQISKDDLSYAEITYDHYQDGPNSRHKSRRIIYSTDGVAYGFGTIVDVNEELLSQIGKGQEVSIYYRNYNDSYYDYEIIEMYYHDTAIMTVEDYHEDYSKQVILSFSLCIGLIIIEVFFAFFFPKLMEKSRNKKSGKNKVDFESPKAMAQYNGYKEMIKNDGNTYNAGLAECFEKKDFDIQILYKYFYDEMESQEIRLIYEDAAVDEIAYLTYKYNGKILFEAAFINKEGKMEIDELLIAWTYPEYSEFNEFERKMFYQSIERFSKMQGIEFIFSNEDNRLIENRSKKK
jgi:hypothetical protein